jgi:ATP synthase F1 complex assembly factor 2
MSSSAGAAGNRLTGRSRFYKQVGIKALERPPWEDMESTTSAQSENLESDSIASPISAGVDGSQSATGVHHIPQQDSSSLSSVEQLLTPRRPGDEAIDGDSDSCSWFGIALDGRTVSTPMGQTLAVPSETLAYMIAAEWDAQTQELQPSNMPLMTLACTALDQAAIHPKFYRDAALQYLPTDTVRACLLAFWMDT